MLQEQASIDRTTEDLVRDLAREAGRSRGPRPSVAALLFLATVVALAAALAVVLLLADVRDDLPIVWNGRAFLSKMAAMSFLAAGGLLLVRAHAIPGEKASFVLALGPAMLILVANLLADPSGSPLLGLRPPLSAAICIGTIILASIPALILFMSALRRGLPTRLRRAGFFAGLAAGAIGALAYTPACVNDGAAFVALWYSLSVLVMAAIGWAFGPIWLAW